MSAPSGSGPVAPARRLGWLGGSFDPVHAGHLHIARHARDALDLERVLLVPAALPPHKLDVRQAPGPDRLALLEIACADDATLEPCDVELQREGPSWSIDTAEQLVERLGADVALYCIVGADTLADLHTWRRLDDLVRLVTFCPVSRPGTPLDAEPLRAVLPDADVDRIAAHALAVEPHPASSTAVRADLVAGRPCEHLPPGIADEIARRGLYPSQAGGLSSRSGS